MKGVHYHEVLNQNETVNAKYCHKLETLHKILQEKFPLLVNHKDVLLLHDNARAHHSEQNYGTKYEGFALSSLLLLPSSI